MGYQDNGYTAQNLAYATAETRPENPPALAGAGTEIPITSENDDAPFLVSDFVKSWPASNDWSLNLVDSDDEVLKTILSGASGSPDVSELSYDIENDYTSSFDDGYVGGTLTSPPVIASFDAFLVSSDDSTGKTRSIPVRMVGNDCWDGAIAAIDRNTNGTAEPSGNYPLTVDVSEFFDNDGGFTWECSLDGETWDTEIVIQSIPDDQSSTPVYLRATAPCPTDDIEVAFVRADPI